MPDDGPSKLRVTHYLETIRIEQGGVTRAVLDMCKVMAARGHEVVLITCDPQDVPGPWMAGAAGSPRVVRLPGPASPQHRLSRRALEQAQALLEPGDVLHLHGAWTYGSVQLARLAAARGVPYIVTPHGMLDDWSMRQGWLKKRLFLLTLGRGYLGRAAAIHYTAQAEAQQGRQRAPRVTGTVIPYIVDLTPFEALPGPQMARGAFALESRFKNGEDPHPNPLPKKGERVWEQPLGADGVPVVLFLSRLHPKKGVEVLLEASGILRRRGVKHRLVIAGPSEPAYLATLQAMAAQHELSPHVQFVGVVRDAMKLSLYQASSVFVLPTSQENFGLVLIESLACGTPVVTTRGVDIWKELEDAGGVVVEQDAEALASALAKLLADRAALAALGSRGRRWVFERLNSDAVAREYEAMYRNAQRRGKGSNDE